MKRALITGITGQDGAYLARFLIKKGYKVFGTYRRLSTPNFWRLHHLQIFDKVELIPGDIIDSGSVAQALEKSNPHEIYHLAAQSFVDVSFNQPLYTGNMTGFGCVRILEQLNKFNSKIKFYQASSSEMFGVEKSPVKNEKTPFHPVSPYGVAKVYAFWMVNMYRKIYGLHASNGILFNHESPIRGLEFVTRHISNGVAKISLGLSKELYLGNLASKRDWGYAPEFVEGMWTMLQQKNPDDYVIATGESHSVEEFLALATEYTGLGDWREYVEIDYELRPTDIDVLVGDSSKAQKQLLWKPKMKFKDLIKNMVEHDLEYFKLRSDPINDDTD